MSLVHKNTCFITYTWTFNHDEKFDAHKKHVLEENIEYYGMLPTTIDGLYDEGVCAYIDEAGRGPGAGCVCAAVVVWPKDYVPATKEDEKLLNMIRDSKKLSQKQREKLEVFIKANAQEYAVATIDNEEIDSINILQATFKAMHNALDQLTVNLDRIFVDGNRFKTYVDQGGSFIPHTCIVNGDGTLLQIAAASILAKTHRDKMMVELHESDDALKVYGWDTNKGYLTKAHMDAIKAHGLSSHHRRSFIHL
jgi:ribonuclease HII